MDTDRTMDAARWSGVLVLGALGVLVLLRKGFKGISVGIGD